IPSVDVDELWAMRARFVFGEISISEDDDRVAFVHETRLSAVDDDLPRTAVSLNGIGGQPAHVVYIKHLHLFVRNDVRGFHQERVDGDASFVVDIGAGHRGAMYLAFSIVRIAFSPPPVRARENPFDDRKGSTRPLKGTLSVCSVSVAVRSKRRWLYGLPAHRPAVRRGRWPCKCSRRGRQVNATMCRSFSRRTLLRRSGHWREHRAVGGQKPLKLYPYGVGSGPSQRRDLRLAHGPEALYADRRIVGAAGRRRAELKLCPYELV